MMTDVSPLDAQAARRDDQYWAHLKDVLVDHLVEVTGREYALFRTEDRESGKLLLESYARHRSARPVTEDFCIPKLKDARCWVTNPLLTWGMCNVPGGMEAEEDYAESDESTEQIQCEYTPGERAFVDRVRHKAWFPIWLNEVKDALVILADTRQDQPCQFSHVALWWLFSQLLVSSGMGNCRHRGIVAATEQLPSIAALDDRFMVLNYVGLCLASGRGLGWNRVWFLRQSGTDTYECDACIGEVSWQRWHRAVAETESSTENLYDELGYLVSRETYRHHSLYEACHGLELSITLGGFDRYLERQWAIREGRVEARGLCMVKPISRNIAGDFGARVEGRAKEKFGIFEGQEADVYWYPVSFGGTRYLVFLSQPFVVGDAPRILTTVFLEAASLIAAEVLAKDLEGAIGDACQSALSVVKSFSGVLPLNFSHPDEFSDFVHALSALKRWREGPHDVRNSEFVTRIARKDAQGRSDD